MTYTDELRRIEQDAREMGEWHAQQVAVYYDISPDKHLTTDTEGCLVTLCGFHADKHYRSIQHACDAEPGAECELCLEESQCS